MIQEMVSKKAQAAKQASQEVALLNTHQKDEILLAMADALVKESDAIIAANSQDLAQGVVKGLSKAMMDRLMLNRDRIVAMADGLRKVADLPDPVGEVLEGFTRANGLEIKKVRVPLGVVGMIYEARPNVTIDAAGLCLKSGNSVVLRGGSEAVNSNRKMVEILRRVLNKKGVDEAAISFIDNTDRQAVDVMMNQKGIIDVLIPRGGAGLIKKVVEGSRVPVIETGAGVCHVYVDKAADLDMAERIVINAKVSRPAVCNAMETLLIHEDVAAEFLPPILRSLKAAGVEIRGCNRTIHFDDEINAAEASDWATEYNDLILSVKIVSTIDEAIDHINRYNTKHSETIVTNDYNRARRFQKLVDAAVVYVNASTRFTDGFEFGFGAEIGISTQKLHARGPMGLRELTTTKYLVCGDGQIRA